MSRFTHFCVEQNYPTSLVRGVEMANIMYGKRGPLPPHCVGGGEIHQGRVKLKISLES